jgi:hypothetical protein
MFIAEEEHERDGIVKFIHLFKVRNLVEVTDIDDSKVLHTIGDACSLLVNLASKQGKEVGRTIKNFILAHAVGVPVTAEAYDYQALFFRKYGLINVPSGD